MNPMTREQRTAVQDALGFAVGADADGVLKAVRAFQYADRQRSNPVAVAQALNAAQSLAKRLLRVEEDYATTRTAIARLEVANARGDFYGLRDLAAELEQAGIDLKSDYDHADDLARAEEQGGLL